MVQIIPCHFSWFFFFVLVCRCELTPWRDFIAFCTKILSQRENIPWNRIQLSHLPSPPPILPRPGRKFREKFFFISVGIVAIQHTDSMLPFVCMSILLHFRWIMTSKCHWCQSKCVYNSAYHLTFIQSFHHRIPIADLYFRD